MAKRILFTGGGSAGHVSVNLALIPLFLRNGWDVAYIGSENGIERELIGKFDDVRYYPIATGKLRRYFDWKNFKDPFRVVKGVWQAAALIRKWKPQVVFSKGGFVAVPVVTGAWLNRVPVIIHESDFTPGLANRLSIPFASKVCTTFPETTRQLKSQKAEYIGAVVREELKNGSVTQGLNFCRFVRGKPVLLIMGGSLGARCINEALRANLDKFTADFQIVHLCGKGGTEPALEQRNYRQFEFLHGELPDIMAMADVVVSRAGSNSIFEFLALRKPMLLIPLSKTSSRGDQILNARSFKDAGFGYVLQEEELNQDSLLDAVHQVFEARDQLIANMKRHDASAPAQRLQLMLEQYALR